MHAENIRVERGKSPLLVELFTFVYNSIRRSAMRVPVQEEYTNVRRLPVEGAARPAPVGSKGRPPTRGRAAGGVRQSPGSV